MWSNQKEPTPYHQGEEHYYGNGKIEPRPPFYRRYGWQILVGILILGIMLLAAFNVILWNRPSRTVEILVTQIVTSKPTQPNLVPTTAPTPTPTPINFPTLAVQYSGIIHNTTYNITSTLLLTSILQNQNQFSGNLIIGQGLGGSGPFTGTIDSNGNVSITNKPNDGGGPIILNGSLQQDGSLKGTYIIPSVNEGGTWDVKPS